MNLLPLDYESSMQPLHFSAILRVFLSTTLKIMKKAVTLFSETSLIFYIADKIKEPLDVNCIYNFNLMKCQKIKPHFIIPLCTRYFKVRIGFYILKIPKVSEQTCSQAIKFKST